MQSPAASCPRKTLNPNVNFPVTEGSTTAKYSGWTASSGVSGLRGGSMRPPPVHFPVGHWAGGGVTQKFGRFGAMLTFGWSVHAESQHGAEPPELLGQDRKSTRLNSSHPSISYAVFCLKKKNAGIHHSHS